MPNQPPPRSRKASHPGSLIKPPGSADSLSPPEDKVDRAWRDLLQVQDDLHRVRDEVVSELEHLRERLDENEKATRHASEQLAGTVSRMERAMASMSDKFAEMRETQRDLMDAQRELRQRTRDSDELLADKIREVSREVASKAAKEQSAETKGRVLLYVTPATVISLLAWLWSLMGGHQLPVPQDNVTLPTRPAHSVNH